MIKRKGQVFEIFLALLIIAIFIGLLSYAFEHRTLTSGGFSIGTIFTEGGSSHTQTIKHSDNPAPSVSIPTSSSGWSDSSWGSDSGSWGGSSYSSDGGGWSSSSSTSDSGGW